MVAVLCWEEGFSPVRQDLRVVWIIAAAALCLFLATACPAAVPAGPEPQPVPGDRLERIKGSFDAYVAAAGLQSPDGLAFHPRTGELYVSEETAGRVSVIRQGRPVPAMTREWSVIESIPDWAVTRASPLERWLKPRLESPEGIAFSSDGHLFVTEDIPHGRVLEFVPNEQGVFSDARAIPIPWLEHGYAWEGIYVAEDDHLYLAGSSLENGPGLAFGAVLSRDPDGNWAVVDYSPFASFSALAMSREEDILVVGEETFIGSVSWWDTIRRLPIGTVTNVLANVEGLCVLPDGSLLAAQETEPGKGGGRLLRVNPQTGAFEVAAEGFGTVESVVVSPKTQFVYVTEDSTGLIIELRPKEPFAKTGYLLQRSLRTYEAVEGLAPKQWPPFLRQFFTELGVRTRDESAIVPIEPGKPPPKKDILSITLQDLGARIPLIAGKLRTTPVPGTEAVPTDPVVQMDFIVFFPNQMLKNGICTPSLSLFSARRKSGRVERTQVMGGLSKAVRYSDGKGWIKECDNAQLYLPLTSCSAVRNDFGTDVSLAFLGLGIMEDYYFHILLGGENKGELVMQDNKGQLASYDVTVTEHDERGIEHVNVVVTGFGPHYEGEPMWLDIGRQPIWDVMNDPRKEMWISYWISRHGHELIDQIARNQEQWRMALRRRERDEREAAKPRPPFGPALSEDKAGEDKVEAGPEKDTPVSSNPATDDPDRERKAAWTNILLSRALSFWKDRAF